MCVCVYVCVCVCVRVCVSTFWPPPQKKQMSLVACCSVLQCVSVCFSVLQSVAVCCGVLQCVAVCCRVLRIVAVRCSHPLLQGVAGSCRELQCVAVCCSVKSRSAYCALYSCGGKHHSTWHINNGGIYISPIKHVNESCHT